MRQLDRIEEMLLQVLEAQQGLAGNLIRVAECTIDRERRLSLELVRANSKAIQEAIHDCLERCIP